MSKKILICMIPIFGIGLLISPIPFSYAEDNSKQQEKVQVEFILDESLVDISIDQLKEKDIIIQKDKDGKYVVIILNEHENETKQAITKKEAKELGYVENIVNNLPIDSEIFIEKDDEGRYIATIIDVQGNETKQVITEDEALKLRYIDKNESDYVPVIKDEKGEETNIVTIDKEPKQTGLPLPETATDIFNLLMIGGVLIVSGFVLFLMRRRKSV